MSLYESFQERMLRIFPAFTVWITFIVFFGMSFVKPVWVAYLVIIYDVFWLVKAIHLSFHLISSYRRLSRTSQINWEERLEKLSDVESYVNDVSIRRKEIKTKRSYFLSHVLFFKKHQQKLQRDMKSVNEEYEEIATLYKRGVTQRNWKEIYHLVVMPTYKEGIEVLEESLSAIVKTTFPLDRIIFILATEERDHAHAQKNASFLQKKYGHTFFKYINIEHPENVPGEAKVKGANVTHALRYGKKFIDEQQISHDHVIVSVFDADTQPGPEYFSALTYYFLTTKKPYQTSYQPIPMYNNNLWDTPALMRVVAVGTSFWYLIESSRPDRLCTFSSHSMSLRALIDVDYYPVDVVSDDSRIFYRCFLHYNGDYEVKPMFVIVSMDALARNTFFRTVVNQYKQMRRWAWGIENLPFVISNFIKKNTIPMWKKIVLVYRIFEGNYTWATTALIVAFAGWFPVLFGGDEFEKTVISQNFLFVAQILMTAALFGLIVSIVISLLLLPKLPPGKSKKWYITILQWFLIPVTTIIFGSIPAVDAQTRLALGGKMEFSVTEKKRNQGKH